MLQTRRDCVSFRFSLVAFRLRNVGHVGLEESWEFRAKVGIRTTISNQDQDPAWRRRCRRLNTRVGVALTVGMVVWWYGGPAVASG